MTRINAAVRERGLVDGEIGRGTCVRSVPDPGDVSRIYRGEGREGAPVSSAIVSAITRKAFMICIAPRTLI